MKKVLFTSMVLLSVLSWTGNVYAQEAATDTEGTEIPATAQAKVAFTLSADGKTLTISGQGDLTTLTKVSDELKFTSAGCAKVGTANNMYNNLPVGESAIYNSETVYYAHYPEKLPSLYPDFVDASVSYAWDDDKIGNLYHVTYVNGVAQWTKVQPSDEIDKTDGWVNQTRYSNYATSEDGSNRILYDDFLNGGYYKTILSNVKFKSNKLFYLYVVENNKYVQIASDSQYDADETYYSFDITLNDKSLNHFGQISEDEMLKMGYLDRPSETLAVMLNNLLSNNNTFTTIKFVNEDTAQPLMINNDIVKAILYPASSSTTSKSNDVLTTLDLSAATCVDFSKETFAQGKASGSPVLETLTLPLSVTNETPKGVVSYLQGEYNKLTKVVIPEGYAKIGDQTFCELGENNGAATKLTEVVLPSSLEEIGESAFRNCSSLKNIKFNDGLKTIGKYAFTGTGLEGTLTLPASLDKVCDGAFWFLPKLTVLELNEKLRYIGNGAFGSESQLVDKSKTQTTIKIPASVRYIGAYAFAERKYQDIYFLGKVAPVCPVGEFVVGDQTKKDGTAFTGSDDKVHFGNSGFIEKANDKYPLADDAAKDGYANRENYNNDGNYFTILHYPSDATDVDTYTDTTRKFECRVKSDGKIDNSTTHVGGEEKGSLNYREATNVEQDVDPGYADTYVGAQYVWPSQAQFIRAYATAAHGVKWDGTTPYAPELSDDVLAVLREAGYEESAEDLAKIAYIGTRKFSIANGDGKSLPSYKFDVKPGEWWTICVPFNMTKKQVLDAFGAKTQLCLFRSVVRQIDINNMNHISLKFTLSALNHKTSDKDGKKLQTETGRWDYEKIEESEDEVGDNDIVLWAHESYMIKPYGGAYSDKEPTYVMASYEAVEGNPLPTIVHATTKTLGQADDFTEEYRFIGNYLGNSEAKAAPVIIPQYSYVYATTKKEPNVCKFRFYTGTSAVWKPNKSIVQTNNRGGGEFDYNNFFGGENGTTMPGAAKQASIFGDEDFGQATGIDDVTIIVGSETLTPVFNLEGKVVSANGNIEGLAKGVYIKGGKKFVVK